MFGWLAGLCLGPEEAKQGSLRWTVAPQQGGLAQGVARQAGGTCVPEGGLTQTPAQTSTKPGVSMEQLGAGSGLVALAGTFQRVVGSEIPNPSPSL